MRQIENEFITALAPLYDAAEAKDIARILLQDVLQCDFTYLVTHSPLALSSPQRDWLDAAIARLMAGEPLQYVEGQAHFHGLSFRVGPGCLIPRPETAELVDWVVDGCGRIASLSPGFEQRPRRILDVGTGSGCIAVSLAHALPGAIVSAVDVSEDALRIARGNASLNGVEVEFEKLDILSGEPLGRFDVIVSNPPYICLSERAVMHKNVLDFEPALALFVPDADPLLFYRRIAEIGTKHLDAGGELYFEINERFGPQTVDMLSQMGYMNVELRQDFYGKDRMVRGRLPLSVS